MWKPVRFYTLVIAGFALLFVAVSLAFTRPLWLIVLGPPLLVWSVWLLHTYWEWVRKLGR